MTNEITSESIEKIFNEIESDANELHPLINKSLGEIFLNVDELVKEKKFNIVQCYIRGLAIDMLGKILTFPKIEKQSEADLISWWVKNRYKIDMEIKIKS